MLYHMCGTVCVMNFRLNTASGHPLYLQLIEQVRHAVETGVLQDGDLMPSIRAMAEELVISHNTVAKAYSELQHEGLLELRHGSGAYISVPRSDTKRAARLQKAMIRVHGVVDGLLDDGFSPDEIRRLFEAKLIPTTAGTRKS